jgi:hypothetical protein
MHLSGTTKFVRAKQKESDLGEWKEAGEHESRFGITYTIYRCPFRHRAECKCTLRVVRGDDFVELQRCGVHENGCHDNDKSKHLKIKQIINIQEAAIVNPRASGAELCRNMLVLDSPTKTFEGKDKRSVQRAVTVARKHLVDLQAAAAPHKDSFGEYSKFAATNRWGELLAKHNDPDDPYHLSLYDYVLIGSEVQAAHGILRINFSSLWMLMNYLRSLQAGWGVQLNGDGTGDFCRHAVDMISLTVTSIPHQTNVLCISIIPQKGESEKAYRFIWEDVRAAIVLLAGFRPCDKSDCEVCCRVNALLTDANVSDFLKSEDFTIRRRLLVDTAMCDNFRAWGNFARKSLGLRSWLVCLPHASGNVLCSNSRFPDSDGGVRQQSPQTTTRTGNIFRIAMRMTIITIW